jgi:hypothetical protein
VWPCLASQDSIVEAKKTGGSIWYEAKVKSVKGGFTVVAYLGPGLGADANNTDAPVAP